MGPATTRFPALGTTAVVAVTAPEQLMPARGRVERVIDAYDRACSRFRADSELEAVCRAPGRSVQVSPLLARAIAAGMRAAVVTDGDVDPTLGSALRALGYDRDFNELSRRGPARVRVVEKPGWRAIRFDPQARTVQLPTGVELDLGATAKAQCADAAAAAAHDATGAGVLVSLGGDIALAGEPPLEGWRIRVTDDHRDALAPGQWITLRTGALATSSTCVRRWSTESGPAHHLLDPATGRPAQVHWRTVSVCAQCCLDANIASTAAVVRGPRAVPWLSVLRLPSRLVSVEGAALHLAGWPSRGEELPVAAGDGVLVGERR